MNRKIQNKYLSILFLIYTIGFFIIGFYSLYMNTSRPDLDIFCSIVSGLMGFCCGFMSLVFYNGYKIKED